MFVIGGSIYSYSKENYNYKAYELYIDVTYSYLIIIAVSSKFTANELVNCFCINFCTYYVASTGGLYYISCVYNVCSYIAS